MVKGSEIQYSFVIIQYLKLHSNNISQDRDNEPLIAKRVV